MKALNKVMLIGNVGSDPEVRTTAAGSKVENLLMLGGRTASSPEDHDEDWDL